MPEETIKTSNDLTEPSWVPGTEVELTQEFIVLAIPAATLEVNITAKIYHEGEIHSVHKTMDFEEVREAIEEAKDGYIPSDALFSLTPLGEKVAAELQARYRGDAEGVECI